MPKIALRIVAYVAGLVVIAATAHVNVTNAGGYAAPGAVLTLAIALGVATAAMAIGEAWSARRYGLALWLMAAIVAGEAFAFLATGERLVVGREAQQAPLRDAEDLHAKAAQRVTVALRAVSATPATSPRLDAAIIAKTAADKAAIDKSAEKGCAVNCRSLLQSQVDAAQTEVAAARAEIEAAHSAADRELAAARAALAGVKAPASATPLADRVGLAAWALDLLAAALGSLAANGLGCGLIAFASHGRREAPAILLDAVPDSSRKNVAEHAARFAIEALAPADTTTPLVRLHGAYTDWCRQGGIAPLPAREIAGALNDLFRKTGLAVAEIEGTPHLMGAKLKSIPARKALGRMATVGSST